MQIKFKATRKKSKSFGAYRQIVKTGDLDKDALGGSDDSILITVTKPSTIIIDCDKKTGEFRLSVSD